MADLAHPTEHTTRYILAATHYTLQATCYMIHATRSRLYTIHYTLYTTHYTLLTTHYKLHTAYYTLYTATGPLQVHWWTKIPYAPFLSASWLEEKEDGGHQCAEYHQEEWGQLLLHLPFNIDEGLGCWRWGECQTLNLYWPIYLHLYMILYLHLYLHLHLHLYQHLHQHLHMHRQLNIKLKLNRQLKLTLRLHLYLYLNFHLQYQGDPCTMEEGGCASSPLNPAPGSLASPSIVSSSSLLKNMESLEKGNMVYPSCYHMIAYFTPCFPFAILCCHWSIFLMDPFQPGPPCFILFNSAPPYCSWFLFIPAYSSWFYCMLSYTSLFHHIIAYSSSCQTIPAYFSPSLTFPAHSSSFQSIPAHTSPFQPSPADSTVFFGPIWPNLISTSLVSRFEK